MHSENPLNISVVVITYMRPDVLRCCLAALACQSRPAAQVIVVDSSPDFESQVVTANFGWATYIRNPAGAGNMTNSRNVALLVTTGEVIAFLDDDAFPEPTYLEAVAIAYSSPDVYLSCSRTLNNVPGEGTHCTNAIGRFTSEGNLVGNFGADPGRDVEIEHGIGATMSFRRTLLARLGGFREDFAGISGVREDTDAFFRARALGYNAVFISKAIAQHIGAPQAHGRRFDIRYDHWCHRNHMVLLANNFGLWSRLTSASVRSAVAHAWQKPSRSLGRRIIRLGAVSSGLLRGLVAGFRLNGLQARDPERNDVDAKIIRARLEVGATLGLST